MSDTMICEFDGHEWGEAGGGLLICLRCETEQWRSGQQPETTAPPYRRHRTDGWPYCPRCDEDELWSNAMPATVGTIVGCYSCGWKSGDAA